MNTIEFRAWNPVSKKMHYGTDVYLSQGPRDYCYSPVMTNGVDVDQILMLYTNFNDIFKNKIYDKDIINYTVKGSLILGIVYWGNGSWQVVDFKGGNVASLSKSSSKKVISNIYEFPNIELISPGVLRRLNAL